MATQVIAQIAQEEDLSQLRRIGCLFFNPSRLFNEIGNGRTAWWVPFIITIICSYAMTFTSASKVGFRQLTENMLRSDPAMAERMTNTMSRDEQNSVIDTAALSFKISSYTVPALVLLYNVVYAIVLLMGLCLFSSKGIKFRSVFSVLLYADLIQNVRSLCTIVILFLLEDPSKFDLQTAQAFAAPGVYFATQGTGSFTDAAWFHTLAGSVDMITIWYLLIIAFGCSLIARIKRSSAFAVVFGLWAMVVACRVMWAAMS